MRIGQGGAITLTFFGTATALVYRHVPPNHGFQSDPPGAARA
jgi:hypothetical protein